MLTRKKKSEGNSEYTCTTDSEKETIVLRRVAKDDQMSNDTSKTKDEVDKLLDEAEKAIKKSEDMTKEYLGSPLNATVEDLLNDSDHLEAALNTVRGTFSAEGFIRKLMTSISEEDKEKIANELKKSETVTKVTPTVRPLVEQDAGYTLQKLQETSARIMSRWKPTYEKNEPTTGTSETKTVPASKKYPSIRAALNLKPQSGEGATKRSSVHFCDKPAVSASIPKSSSSKKQVPTIAIPNMSSSKNDMPRSILKPHLRKSNAKSVTDNIPKVALKRKSVSKTGSGEVEKKRKVQNVENECPKSTSKPTPIHQSNAKSVTDNVPKVAVKRKSVSKTGSGEVEKKRKVQNVENECPKSTSKPTPSTEDSGAKITTKQVAPPPAHSHTRVKSSYEVQSFALDLTTKAKRSGDPMYVDGAHDESSISSTSEISSSILETQSQEDPTQPPSPPVNVSPSVPADVMEIQESEPVYECVENSDEDPDATVSEEGSIKPVNEGGEMLDEYPDGAVSEDGSIKPVNEGGDMSDEDPDGAVSEDGSIKPVNEGGDMSDEDPDGAVSEDGSINPVNEGAEISGEDPDGTVSEDGPIKQVNEGEEISGEDPDGTVSEDGPIKPVNEGGEISDENPDGTVSEEGSINNYSDLSTITISSHGTFASENQSGDEEADESSPVPHSSTSTDEYSSPLISLNLSPKILVRQPNEAQSLNGTCNVNLTAILEGDEDDEIVSGSEINSQREHSDLTIEDVVSDREFEKFKDNLFVTSSPKRPPRFRKKTMQKDFQYSSSSSDNPDEPGKKTKKRSYGVLYGPVNNGKGWIKLKCPPTSSDSVSSDSPKRRKNSVNHSAADPMISGESSDTLSQEEDRFLDASPPPDEASFAVPSAFNVGEHVVRLIKSNA